MRIVLVGKRSFIARAIVEAARVRGIECLALSHDDNLQGLARDDTVINCAIHPTYRSGPYVPALDYDLKAATQARQAQAHFIMLSTRRVYAAPDRWDATETAIARGDNTAYGQNKAQSEDAVNAIFSGKAGIFRLSNVFGYEYDAMAARRSFFGLMLTSLKKENTIFFDMHPDTRRDFLPVVLTAQLLLDRALQRTEGIYNLGSGAGLPCGRFADWVRDGYGGGNLVCTFPSIHDEFFLNMDKWRERFEMPVNEGVLNDYCTNLGRRLKCEKS